tara:strand:+ start:206 stop:466 length:261 start_codon:yes stop_codon:yes gene_type:complete
MKKFIILFLMVSFLISSETKKEVGTYQIATTSATSNKGKVYIVETIIDTRTGTIISRNKIYLSKYKLPTKDRYNKPINKIEGWWNK